MALDFPLPFLPMRSVSSGRDSTAFRKLLNSVSQSASRIATGGRDRGRLIELPC